ncbi:MAG: N-acetylglucosamine kinase [Cyclobacteriaceae bacterium]|nr:N-acetylglucosamine kinase [Cyclobacteriaceae bacterium]MCH8514948.1 N-acetylglucosamine kinase [Cyclobacteriaceae bacterium]
MIWIADSGGTKTDYRLISERGVEQHQGMGLNPYHLGESQLANEIEGLKLKFGKPDKFYFYGAGLGTAEMRDQFQKQLQQVLPDVLIEVYADMVGTSRALAGKNAGICCILGTGANACLYDGEKIVQQRPALGFVLGDEGSGSYLGKQILRRYLYGELNDKMKSAFESRFQVTQADILKAVYQEKKPAFYLASYAPFLFDHIQEPSIARLVYDAFAFFIEQHVVPLDPKKQYRLHFTGGVAFNFMDMLRTVCADMGYTLGNVVEKPIAGLSLYHQGKI